jgi:YfiH family protein
MVIQSLQHGDLVNEVVGDGLPTEGDGLVTNQPDWILGTRVADCATVLLYDPKTNATASIHSGWRSTLAQIVPKAIHRLDQLYGTKAADLWAYMGPAAQPCHYEVQSNVAGQFGTRYIQVRDGKHWLDHQSAVYDQLINAGVPADHIERNLQCTIHEEQFPSYRRNGTTQRMIAAIGLK